MAKKQSIIAMIPARLGSTRLKIKNLALLANKPLIYYAVNAARKSGIFDKIVINSESLFFKKIAQRYDINFYNRPSILASSTAKSDLVVYDFLKNNSCDIVAWVNPIAPLQSPEEIRAIVEYFIKNRLDSLITVKDEQVHCVYKGKPVNFKFKGLFAQTQDLLPVQSFVYSVMIWRTKVFMRTFKRNGYAFFCGKTGFYPVNKLSTFIIKRKEDLMVADFILRAMSAADYRVRYDSIMENKEMSR